MEIKNMSDGKLKFWVFTALYLITMVADMSITYIGTPDLANEGNPLVSVFSLGWKALIAVNIIVFILLVWLFYYTFIQYKRSVIHCENYKQYISMLYFRRPDKFNWTFYKFPKNKGVFVACVGYIGAIIVPLFRLFFIAEWIGCIYFHDFIHRFYCHNIMTWRITIFSVLIIFGIFLSYYWGYLEYKINKKASA